MIPKVIYICDKTLQDIDLNLSSWQKLNPEYTIKTFDDEMCRSFILKEYSALHLEIYDFLKDGPIKADFWRICVLKKYGGVYVDSDIEPLVPLLNFVEQDDNFITCLGVCRNKTYYLNPNFIACNKNDHAINACLERYLEKYLNKDNYDYWSWSICTIMTRILPDVNKELVYYVNGKKCKFLLETFVASENKIEQLLIENCIENKTLKNKIKRSAVLYKNNIIFYSKNLKYKSQGISFIKNLLEDPK